jgi:hypothetical protein
MTMETADIPTLYEWVGGIERLEMLFMRFYERVPIDPFLAPVFAAMPTEHFRAVARFVAEVLGGQFSVRACRLLGMGLATGGPQFRDSRQSDRQRSADA